MGKLVRQVGVFGILGLVTIACTSAPEESVAPETSQDALFFGCGPDRLIANAPPSRRAILERAAAWIRTPVPYSQSDYKDGHRTDCSGYVALAWGRSDFTTAQIPPRQDPSSIAEVIDWGELTPGDAIARGPTPVSSDGHVMLYAGDDYLGFACFWEQTHGGTQTSSILKTTLTGFGQYTPIRER